MPSPTSARFIRRRTRAGLREPREPRRLRDGRPRARSALCGKIPPETNMFERSGHLYDELYASKDYAGEAARLRAFLSAQGVPGDGTLLDVACGTGKHLAELRRWYACEGVDLDPT